MINQFPVIQVAFNGWEYPITLKKITQTNTDFETVNTEEIIYFTGVIQPFNAQQLMIKPIGERSWQWFMIHTRIQIALETNDQITFNDENYKVMEQTPFNLNGYYEYHIIKNYQ